MRNPHSRAKSGLTGVVELVDNTKPGERRANGPAHGNGTEVRMPEQLTCFYYDCERPATALLVNTEHDTFPFKNGAAVACEAHARGLLAGTGIHACVRVEGWPDDESACICPPALLARGGLRGGCPVHAV